MLPTSCGMLRSTHIMWHAAHTTWYVAHIIWHFAHIIWHAANIMWQDIYGGSPICAHSGSYPQKLTKQSEWAKYKCLHIISFFINKTTRMGMGNIQMFAHYIVFIVNNLLFITFILEWGQHRIGCFQLNTSMTDKSFIVDKFNTVENLLYMW